MCVCRSGEAWRDAACRGVPWRDVSFVLYWVGLDTHHKQEKQLFADRCPEVDAVPQCLLDGAGGRQGRWGSSRWEWSESKTLEERQTETLGDLCGVVRWALL